MTTTRSADELAFPDSALSTATGPADAPARQLLDRATGGRSVWVNAVLCAVPAVVVSAALLGWMLQRSAAGVNTAGLQMPAMDLQHRVAYWWPFLMSEALGISALIWSYLSVVIGLAFSTRSPRLGLTRQQVNTLHRYVSMTSLFLIAGHVLFVAIGSMNDAMTTRTVNVAEALLPFQTSWNGTFYNVGVFSLYLAILLGPSYYLRRHLGAKAWRIVHRASLVVYILAVWHTIGFDDFDFHGPYRLALWLAQIPLVGLLLWRLAAPVGSVRNRRRSLPIRVAVTLGAAATLGWIIAILINGIGGSASPFDRPGAAQPGSSTPGDTMPGMPGM